MDHLTNEVSKESFPIQDLAAASVRLHVMLRITDQVNTSNSAEATEIFSRPGLRLAYHQQFCVHYYINITAYPESVKEKLKDEWSTLLLIVTIPNSTIDEATKLAFEEKAIVRLWALQNELFCTEGGLNDCRLIEMLTMTVGDFYAKKGTFLRHGPQGEGEWSGSEELRELQEKVRLLAREASDKRDLGRGRPAREPVKGVNTVVLSFDV